MGEVQMDITTSGVGGGVSGSSLLSGGANGNIPNGNIPNGNIPNGNMMMHGGVIEEGVCVDSNPVENIGGGGGGTVSGMNGYVYSPENMGNIGGGGMEYNMGGGYMGNVGMDMSQIHQQQYANQQILYNMYGGGLGGGLNSIYGGNGGGGGGGINSIYGGNIGGGGGGGGGLNSIYGGNIGGPPPPPGMYPIINGTTGPMPMAASFYAGIPQFPPPSYHDPYGMINPLSCIVPLPTPHNNILQSKSNRKKKEKKWWCC